MSALAGQYLLRLDSQSIGGFNWLDICFGLAVAQSMRHAGSLRQPWAQALVAYLLSCLSGTALSNLLCGQPPDWMLVDSVLPTYILLFIAHRYCPGDAVFRILAVPAVRLVVNVFDNASWAAAITQSGVAKALNAEHTAARSSMTLALVCGILSGCGGSLINATFSLNQVEWQFRTPIHLSGDQPSYTLRIAVLMTLLFYGLVDPHGLLGTKLLDWNDARLVVFAIILAVDNSAELKRFGPKRAPPKTKTT